MIESDDIFLITIINIQGISFYICLNSFCIKICLNRISWIFTKQPETREMKMRAHRNHFKFKFAKSIVDIIYDISKYWAAILSLLKYFDFMNMIIIWEISLQRISDVDDFASETCLC